MGTADRILDIIDGGLQTSTEHGYTDDGWPAFPVDQSRCPRCQRHPAADGADLCEGCRAFLLEDTDVDPARSWGMADDGALVAPGGWCAPPCAQYHAAIGVDGAVYHLVAARYTISEEAATRAAETMDRITRAIIEATEGMFADLGPALTLAAETIADLGIVVDTEPPSPVEVARERNRAVVAEHRRAHRRTNRLPPNPGRNR
jgi:hypothetical protein